MPEYLTPGVYFEFVDESRRGIAALRTDVAAFIGIAERGPLHTPTRVTSWQQFQSIFGNFISNGFLAYEVKSFFENGGRACYIVHVAAPLAETDTNPAAIQPLDRRSSIVNTIDGFAKGTVVTATQTRATQTSAVPQPIDRSSSLVNDVGGFPQGSLVKVTQSGLITYRHVKAIDAVTKQLFWDEPLDSLYNLALPILFETLHQVDLMLNDVSAATLMWDTPLPAYFDLTQTLHLATGNAAANGDLLDENNEATLRVEAIDPGAWGNAVAVRVTRSTSIATRTADMPQPADHSLSVVESVTGLMIGTLVKVFQAGVANAEYRVVTKVDPTRRTIVWDAALNPAYYDLVDATKLNAPLSIETIEFALSVYLAGQLREVFSGLSLIKDHARYVMKVIAGSNSSLIRVIDLHPTSISDLAIPPFPFPMRLPNPEAANLTRGRLRLRGGRDGIAALKPHDFTGSSSDVTKRGLCTLEEVDEVAIVAMPDILIKPVLPPQKLVRPAPEPIECPVPIEPPIEAEPYTPPMIERAPDFSPDQILSAQQALILHCETLRDRIALIDPPSVSHSELIDAREIQSWRQQFDSSYAALYFPWVLVYDPLKLNGNVVRAIPPSGQVAGVYARTDLEAGVHHAPANAELMWAQGAVENVSPELQGILNPIGINCIRTLSGRGLRVYGARTISSDANWRFVNVRRLMMMIEEAIETSVQWSVFEPNDLDLRNTLIVAISGFLETLWERGALVGATADEAFFVKCDDENNPPYLADAGQLIVDVGVAPVRPAEFVILRIGKTADTLEIGELSSQIGALA